MRRALERATAPGARASDRRGRRRAARVAMAVLLAAGMGGCISEEREQHIGDTMAADVNPHLPIIEDPLLNGYLYGLGRQIGSLSARPDLEYHFYIVNTGTVNAFALPGGHIYLTRGLIERTRDGAEFAGVLAHEIGHVAARHGVQKLQRQLRTGSLVNVLYGAIFGREPELLRDNSLQLANFVWSAQHSRRDEREADRLAVKYLMRSGIDPSGIVTLLETLLEEERLEGYGDSGFEVDWFSTHPLTRDRIRDARRNIDRLAADNPPEIQLDVDSFSAFKLLVMHQARRQLESGW
jgi:beta-barrel assembly-enhancing protease